MVLRSLQPKIARHMVGVPFADFGSLVLALYDVEDDISRRLWIDSSPSDIKGKKSFGIERPSVSYTAIGQPCYAAQFTARPATPYPQPRAQQTSAPFALRTHRQFSQLGMPLSQALRKLTEAGLLTALAPRPPPQPIPPQFRMDLHCAYHQGPGHETDRCTALRHAVQDLIDQGLVHLGQPNVTTNPLLAHTTHAVSLPGDDIHFLDFDEIDDHIYMLSDDDLDPEPIMPDVIYEMSGVTLGPRMSTPFRLVPEAASVQAATVEPLILPHYSVRTPFILIPNVEEPPPATAKPVEGTSAPEEIRVKTTTSPEGLIHMMTVDRAMCIVFSEDDLPPGGSNHTRSLYISVGCSSRRVPSVLLDNGSALNVCPLATAIALGYALFNFGPSTQTVRAYDSTRREVMGTLEIELLIGPTTFVAVFQVLRIPTSFNLLLGRPWIHRAGAIPSSFHQKPVLEISHADDDIFLIGFTFDEVETLEMEDFCRDFVAMSFDQHSSTVVLDIMQSMSYLPGMGLGQRQQGPSDFMAFPDRNVPFGLGFIPIEVDYRYMARLRRERVRARLTHTSFYYPVRPYTMSLADYFVRASEPHAPSDGIIG
ncbi:hypothetical protein CK203_034202 [Vitis vinifera]|uniref:Reverse transcriptase/retrotransposon-derived protein RNase H-like domain-containing protein n=1 Tax=Vitis vinifera TaxID=29760 RepID=A0A438IF06_VITVI|nr:hypothetical protein CK203_034202 [Vitis vinifera]